MSKWRHSICTDCWEKKNPGREPVRLLNEDAELDVCCFCSKPHSEGIYVRENPADMPCNGVHERTA